MSVHETLCPFIILINRSSVLNSNILYAISLIFYRMIIYEALQCMLLEFCFASLLKKLLNFFVLLSSTLPTFIN